MNNEQQLYKKPDYPQDFERLAALLRSKHPRCSDVAGSPSESVNDDLYGRIMTERQRRKRAGIEMCAGCGCGVDINGNGHSTTCPNL